MSRLRSPYLWLAILAAGLVAAVGISMVLLGSAAGLERAIAALAVAALGTLALTGWLRAHQERLRAERLASALEAARQSAGMALRDPLTGLGNQRLFETELRGALARAQRYARPFSILLIEVSAPEL